MPSLDLTMGTKEQESLMMARNNPRKSTVISDGAAPEPRHSESDQGDDGVWSIWQCSHHRRAPTWHAFVGRDLPSHLPKERCSRYLVRAAGDTRVTAEYDNAGSLEHGDKHDSAAITASHHPALIPRARDANTHHKETGEQEESPIPTGVPFQHRSHPAPTAVPAAPTKRIFIPLDTTTSAVRLNIASQPTPMVRPATMILSPSWLLGSHVEPSMRLIFAAVWCLFFIAWVFAGFLLGKTLARLWRDLWAARRTSKSRHGRGPGKQSRRGTYP
jgi:hypothetical protein